MAIIKKKLKQECYKCSGTGLGKLDEIECSVCKGTGKYSEDFYYTIDDKKKICFSMDTLK